MLLTLAPLAALLCGPAFAAGSLNEYPMSLDNGTAPNEGYATFSTAAQSPNVSHSVQFSHYNEGSETPRDDIVRKNWTWTVNLSDVQMPNASTQGLTNVAYTTYDFSWPEEGDLNDALNAEVNASSGQYYPSCALLITALFPDSISKKWDGTSDCTSALGANCAETLSRVLSTSSDCMANFALDDPDLMVACKDSFGSVGGDGWGVSGRVFGNGSVFATDQTSLRKNQTYAFALSAPYTATNTTAFETLAKNLQVLALTGSRTELLCNRAGDGKSLTSSAPASSASTSSASDCRSFESGFVATIAIIVMAMALI